jgi:hypothetical protein
MTSMVALMGVWVLFSIASKISILSSVVSSMSVEATSRRYPLENFDYVSGVKISAVNMQHGVEIAAEK